MKAAFYTGNRTFEVREGTAAPLGPGEVRLQIAYCGVCGTDVHIYHGAMDQRVRIPQVIGHETSGEVVEVGSDVQNVSVGQRVVVRPLQPGEPAPIDNGCTHIGKNLKFIGIDTPGAMQTLWTVPAYTLHHLPETVSLLHGALIEPLAVACHDVRLADVKPDEKVVVIGGGPIGLLIALIAKQKDASVILSEVNPQRLALAKAFGLTTANPQEEDLVAAVEKLTEEAYADVVFEVSGTASGVEMMTKLARVRGRIVMVAIHPQPKPVDLFSFFWRELRMIGARVYEPEDFDEAINLAATGKLPLDEIITQVEPLESIQKLFAAIDQNPNGMKYLLDCR